MLPKPKQCAKALFETVKNFDKDQINQAIKRFVNLLIKNNQTSQIEKIILYFTNFWNKEKCIVEAEIISSRELDENIVQLLHNYIIKLSQAKKVEMRYTVNSNIVGGVIIKYDNKILDASLRRKVDEMRNVLME